MAGETGRQRYAVKSATLTFNSVTYDMASGPVQKGETKEAVNVTALSDQVSQFIPGALKTTDSFTTTLYYKGANDITVDSTPAALSISVTLENGVQDATATVSYAKCIPTKVTAPTVDATSDRKATYDVEWTPDGSAS